MDITEDQMPPTIPRPPTSDKCRPPKERPDTGATPDRINPAEPDEVRDQVDPMPDMAPDGQDPVEGEVTN